FKESKIIEPLYNTSEWTALKNNVQSSECWITLNSLATYKAYYAGGSKCDFPTKDNFNNPSFAYNLSNTDGKIFSTKSYYKLSEDYSTFKLLNIQIADDAAKIAQIPFPDKEPYDSIAPDIDDDIISGDTVAVWKSGESITLNGTTYAPMDGEYSIMRGTYTYTQEFADTGKEVWFATWTGAGNERMYAILHWQKDTNILMYLVPQSGDVYIQGYIFESAEPYTDGMTFTSGNITYTIFQYKPASTTE
ncbi:MAG: hypothetical protein IJ959_00560, partial [Clostridia bacterium]|nr:hypothetical protein [Clostridia bacterium]